MQPCLYRQFDSDLGFSQQNVDGVFSQLNLNNKFVPVMNNLTMRIVKPIVGDRNYVPAANGCFDEGFKTILSQTKQKQLSKRDKTTLNKQSLSNRAGRTAC